MTQKFPVAEISNAGKGIIALSGCRSLAALGIEWKASSINSTTELHSDFCSKKKLSLQRSGVSSPHGEDKVELLIPQETFDDVYTFLCASVEGGGYQHLLCEAFYLLFTQQ